MTVEQTTHASSFVCGSEGPLAISIWDETPTVAHAERANRVLQQLAHGRQRVLVVAVLGAGTQPPSPEVREMLALQLARMGNQIAAVANVVEGEGFRAATLRGVLTGMVFVLRPSYPQKACASIDEAAAFLANHSEQRLDPANISSAIRALRTRRP